MALFTNPGQQNAQGAAAPSMNNKMDVNSEVRAMRSSGLTDDQILSELTSKGAKENAIISALGSLNNEMPMMGNDMGQPPVGAMPGMNNPPMGAGMPSQGPSSDFRLPVNAAPNQGMHPNMGAPLMGGPMNHSGPHGAEDLYGRIEEITEEMINEKWDDLIKEVQKIIEWKNKSESRIAKLENDFTKIKDDFKMLHQGVLGKVEEYDKRMTEVGTELKAVGKVFKDVIPVFTENVKELRDVTKNMKR